MMLEAGTGRLVIIDFGLSKSQQSAVTLGVGTIDVSVWGRRGGSGEGSGVVLHAWQGRDADVWTSLTRPPLLPNPRSTCRPSCWALPPTSRC